MRPFRNRALAALCPLVLVTAGCGAETATPAPPNAGGKSDTAWISSTTFEVDAMLRGTVTTAPTGDLEELATDRALQEQLVDTQLKFAKNSMKHHGYHVNQLAEAVSIRSVEQSDGKVTISYEAKTDMASEPRQGQVPTSLDQLDETEFSVPLPLDPIGVYARAGEDCAADWDPYTLAEYKYYYYFAPDKTDAEGNKLCDLEMTQGKIEITRVQVQKRAFPEYDQLLRDLGDGRTGFRAALMPGEAHDTIQSRLENARGLEAEEVEGESLRRYHLQGDGVEIEIDLFPSAYRFHSALARYQLVYYHGHSSYGTQPYLTNPEAFRTDYQIVQMNSCRPYSYYARQVFRAKATEADPKGWKKADFVANVMSNWIDYSSRALPPLLRHLLAGIEAEHNKRDYEAPDWLTIIKSLDAVDRGVLYGAAGVRDNAWHPEDAQP